ncbi:hypothetical protein P3W45_001725 [Vairimorpha bombi]|jgi:hypothetical protein
MNKGENLDINDLKVEETIINSSTYDEMKFIDDWILYMKESKLDDSHPFSEHIYDEDSSFSSIMNFYLTDDDKYLSSSEETIENAICLNSSEIKNIKLVKNCDDNNIDNLDNNIDNLDDIDLCHKTNLVDSSIDISNICEDFNESSTCDSNIKMKTNLSYNDLDKLIEEENDATMRRSYTSKNYSVESVSFTRNSSTSSPKINYQERFPEKKVIRDKKSSYKINTTVINSTIFMNKLNPQKAIRNAIRQVSFSSSSNEDSLQNNGSMKTYDLISEAEKRTIQQNKRSGGDIPLRKFVIETDNVVIPMNDVLKLTDLRNRTIIGKLSKRSTKGYYTENWVTLRENLFSCYNRQVNKITSTNIPNERNGDIENPEDRNTFLTRKYSIDLLQSRLYLCKKKGKSGIFTCYSENIPAETDLVDITNLVIHSIDESAFGYKVSLQKNNYRAEITLNCLNFGIKTNDGYRFFKLDNVGEFLKWIIAFKFRLGQISLNIG